MQVNSWFQKLYGTQRIMASHDKYCCHKTHKKLWCHKKSWIAVKICDTLLPNGMPCHHHMEEQIVINHKGQHIFN
jgi:hypothetical protein